MNVEYEWRRLGLLLYSKAIVQNSYHESQRRMPQSPKELVTEPRSLGEPRNGSPIEFSLNCPKGVVREEITGTYSSGRGQIRSSVQSSLYSQVRFAATQLDKN
jgi:hypothetical protein